MAAAAMTSFDSLPDEIVLTVIKMASLRDVEKYGDRHDHDFLVDVICNVSVRFRRLSRDSSMWTDHVSIDILTFRLFPSTNDYSKLDFVIRECLNRGTKTLKIWGPEGHPPIVIRIPNRYLIDLATNFPNLKEVELIFIQLEDEGDVPVPWVSGTHWSGHFLTRD